MKVLSEIVGLVIFYTIIGVIIAGVVIDLMKGI